MQVSTPEFPDTASPRYTLQRRNEPAETKAKTAALAKSAVNAELKARYPPIRGGKAEWRCAQSSPHRSLRIFPENREKYWETIVFEPLFRGELAVFCNRFGAICDL